MDSEGHFHRIGEIEFEIEIARLTTAVFTQGLQRFLTSEGCGTPGTECPTTARKALACCAEGGGHNLDRIESESPARRERPNAGDFGPEPGENRRMSRRPPDRCRRSAAPIDQLLLAPDQLRGFERIGWPRAAEACGTRHHSLIDALQPRRPRTPISTAAGSAQNAARLDAR